MSFSTNESSVPSIFIWIIFTSPLRLTLGGLSADYACRGLLEIIPSKGLQTHWASQNLKSGLAQWKAQPHQSHRLFKIQGALAE